MTILTDLKPEICASIAVDCLNTFMKATGKLSIAAFQANVKGLSLQDIQTQLDQVGQRSGELRRFLFDMQVPALQFQDAHVIESIHGKRYHSLEIVREGQNPDFVRTFPPHALLNKNRRFGTDDQRAIDEIALPKAHQVFIRWFDAQWPPEAQLEPQTELIFMKDDFCMAPGTPFVHQLFWELRRQGRFYLIVFGVCDEICNLRNVLLMLSAIFNVIYVTDCTFPLDPAKRQPAIDYMKNFNPLGEGRTGSFITTTSKELMQQFAQLGK